MTPQRVTLITLGVDDLHRAKAFYDALGWQETDRTDGIVFYQLNGAVLGLFGRGPLAADQGRPDAVLGTGAMTLAQNFTTKAEVDAAFSTALAAGAAPLKSPEEVFWGGYSGYFADPDGHVWELAFNPFWPLHPDGSLTLPGAAERIDEPALTTADADAISALLTRSYGIDMDGRSFFQQRPHHRHVLRTDAGLAAHIAVHHRAIRLGDRLVTIAGVGDVATHPDQRGNGYATRLLRRIMDEALAGAADFVILFGDDPLYARLGFVACSQQLRHVDLTGARTGGVVVEPSDGLMVWPCGQDTWDETVIVDLMGDKF